MPVYALAGKKLGHSVSKAWFKAKFEREGLTGFSYINIETDAIEDIRALAAAEQLSGFNVTIPYKSAIIHFLDEVLGDAEKVNAVNKVKCLKNGKLIGYNTDITGFRKSLKPHLRACHSRALIFGTGGASKAVAYVLAELGIEFQFISRHTSSSPALPYSALTNLDIRNAPLLINTTPLGTFPDTETCPDIPYEGIDKYHLLFDLVYNPAETLFLKKGKMYGAATLNGYDMLIRQAEESWRIWQMPEEQV